MSARLWTVAAIAAVALAAQCRAAAAVTPQDPGTKATADELRDAFADLLDVSVEDGRCVARVGDARVVEIVGVAPVDDPVLATPIGRVAIDDWLIVRRGLAPLVALIDAAPAPDAPPKPPAGAGTDFADHRLDFHPLIGPALRVGDATAWTAAGPWQIEVDATLPGRLARLRAALDDAVRRTAGAALGLQETPHHCFVTVAALAALEALDEDSVDEPQPHVVRRMIRHGWLRDVFGERRSDAATGDPVPASRTAQTLEAAVRDACALHVAETWTRGDDRIVRHVDAFGRSSWVRSRPDGHELATRPPIAEFGELDWDFPDDGWVVLELDAQQDPLGPLRADLVRGARFHENGLEIAAWTREDGLSFDQEVWRDDVPIADLVDDLSAADDYLPPHIVLADARGDVAGLVTTHGLLVAPRDGSAAEAERFLADAARLLRATAHLDLLGQYLLSYAYDGPDALRPEILGTAEVQGDRHQTAVETLGSARGGVCVGDCDDLAEVYVDLLRRQGRHALALGIPGHMFAASAEATDDGWAVHVLQTGLAETHRAPELVDAVAAALRAQDPTVEPDPLRIEAWPRIDDEPTRAFTWIDAGALRDPKSVAHVVHHARLETRGLWAASAADRAADVERLHAETADDFDRSARLARLAEALDAVGRFAEAYAAATAAADLARRPAVRVGQRILALECALAAGDRAVAFDALKALDADLDALDGGTLPVSSVHVLLEVVTRLLEAADGGATGARVAVARFPGVMRVLRDRVEGRRDDVAVFDDEWDVVDALDSVAALAARASRLTGDPAHRRSLLDAVRSWVGFARERGELGIWADHAAVLATLRRTDPDAFVSWLEGQRPVIGAPDLTDADVDLGPWLASECIVWEWELEDRLAPGRARPDERTLRTLTRGISRGAMIRRAEESFDEEDAHTQLRSELVESALLGNPAAARAALRLAETWIPDRFPDFADDIALLAPHAALEPWLATVRAWLDTEGRARDAFRVVWATRRTGAHGHAQAAADLVCARFPDDPEFAKERDALRAMSR